MSDCISNVREIVEEEQRLFKILKDRSELIPDYQGKTLRD